MSLSPRLSLGRLRVPRCRFDTTLSLRFTLLQEQGIAFPRIHGLVYAPSDGILKKLPVDFKDILRKNTHVYDLYNEDAQS